MIPWLNFVSLVLSTILVLYFYVRSVGPAALEKKIGPTAYKKCSQFRLIASLFMTLAMVNYVVYVFYPLPIPLSKTFPWSWWISGLIALVIAIPSGYLFARGMIDAGEETMITKKEHSLYGGIYETIRHPQAVGETPFWFVIAFLCHSPFLVLYSFVWIPVFAIMCWAEEQDLLLRYGEAYRDYQQRTGAFFPKRK
jgi:protein-S-isoprenylcysteine O-methyltransferase Ste14